MKGVIHRWSKIFQPITYVPQSSEVIHTKIPKSLRLMIDAGLIRQSASGIFHYLPIGLRALNKLIKVADRNMEKLGAQKLLLSNITSGELWKRTCRWDSKNLDSFKFQDKHNKDYLLSPTHEEAITNLISTIPSLSYKQLPLLLYQISNKYRDETKPRCGLIRSREFLMKDLYSFDVNMNFAKLTYSKVVEVYRKIFEEIGVPFLQAQGLSGDMGGSVSHEFHIPTDIGEDVIKKCQECQSCINMQISNEPQCSNCGATSSTQQNCIEVGHTFLLGTKYSEALNSTYISPDNKKELIVMGSYGLGLSRIIASCIEVLSLPNQIRWPKAFTPFSVVIISPKDGSKESKVCGNLACEIYKHLEVLDCLEDDVLLDDRGFMTIGKRLIDCQKVGYPFIIVIGTKAAQSPSLLELHISDQSQVVYLTLPELLQFFSQKENIDSAVVN